MALVTLYSKSNCVQCNMTKKRLDAKNVNYTVRMVDEDSMALDFVLGMGYSAAPVVVVGFAHPTMGGQHWSGYRPDKLDELLDTGDAPVLE